MRPPGVPMPWFYMDFHTDPMGRVPGLKNMNKGTDTNAYLAWKFFGYLIVSFLFSKRSTVWI